MSLYPFQDEKVEITLTWRVSETPNLETGDYTTVYDGVTLLAVVLPTAFTIRQGEQRRPFSYGAYYDQQRRAFLIDTPHPNLLVRNWITTKDGRRYEIEEIEEISPPPEQLFRVTARQETEVAHKQVVNEIIRSTIFTNKVVKQPVLATIVDDLSSGFELLSGSWTPSVGGYLDHHYGALGPSTASWTLAANAEELYHVAVTWPGGGSSSLVLYEIYDGPTLISTHEVDQQVLPNDFEADGVDWKHITPITPQTNMVKVLIIIEGIFGQGTADAVRLDRLEAV